MSESQGLLTLLEIHFRLFPLSANLPFSTQRVTLLPTLLGKAKLSEHNSHELPSPVPLLRCRLPAEAGVDPTPDSTPATLSHSSSILPFSIASFLCPTSPTCCAELLSHVQLFLTPWTVACQAPLSMGILQVRILEWVVMPSSRGSSQPRNGTRVCCFAGGLFTS